MCDGGRPSPAAFRTNLRAPMPLPRKIGLLLLNSGRKLLRLKSCCGHPGEPGC